jgi:hypothetical protein
MTEVRRVATVLYHRANSPTASLSDYLTADRPSSIWGCMNQFCSPASDSVHGAAQPCAPCYSSSDEARPHTPCRIRTNATTLILFSVTPHFRILRQKRLTSRVLQLPVFPGHGETTKCYPAAAQGERVRRCHLLHKPHI